jgi:hypothetical protein
MSEQLQSGKTSVTGTVVSTPATNNSTPLSGFLTANATTTIATVPANRRWTIVSCWLQQANNGAAVAGCQLRFNGVAAVTLSSNGLSTTIVAAGGLNMEFNNGIVLSAGQTIDTVVPANFSGGYSIAYVSEVV